MSADGESQESISWETPGATSSPSTSPAGGVPDLIEEHPEVLAGAAFVGGLVTALIVRRLGR